MSGLFKQEKPRGSKSNKLGDMSSVQFNCHSVMSDSLWPHRLQHTRLPCPSLSPRACSNSCPLSQRWHPTTSSSIIPFSCLQSFPASGSFLMSRLFASGGQSIGTSALASVFPMTIQSWFSFELTGLISLQFKGLSRVFSNFIIWEYKFFGIQPSLWSNSHIQCNYWKNHSFDCTGLCWQSNVSAF